MNPRSNNFLAAMLAIGLAMASLQVSAEPPNITPAEIAALPSYCPDTIGFKHIDASDGSPSTHKWIGLMGKGFWHMHHHCWALVSIRRAERAGVPAQIRRGMRESALGDFGYVVNNAPKDFILLPEVYTWIGRTEILLDNPRQAEVAFAKARELKADYWPAYSHWAEYLLAKGRRPDALKLVTAGLQQSPDARVLLELYKVLGGKASELPKPLPKKQPEAEPPAGGEPSPPPAPQPAEADPGKDRPADDAYPAAK